MYRRDSTKMLCFERSLLLDSAASPPELHSTQLSRDCQSPVSRTAIDNNDLFLAPGLCDRVGKAFTVSQKAMRTHRTPKALRAKSMGGAHSISRKLFGVRTRPRVAFGTGPSSAVIISRLSRFFATLRGRQTQVDKDTRSQNTKRDVALKLPSTAPRNSVMRSTQSVPVLAWGVGR
jgi:hypothetical protein